MERFLFLLILFFLLFFLLYNYLSNHFNNAKIRKIILAVKQKFNITEDFAFDNLSGVSIQTLITFIGNEAEEI